MDVAVLRQRLLERMRDYFDADGRRIGHAERVLAYAESLLSEVDGADAAVVTAAAILHDIGIHEAERRHGSCSGSFQEIEGPPIAKAMMEELGLDEFFVNEVCEIIANHHSPGKVETLNFKLLYDADWLVNLADEYDVGDREKIEKLIGLIYLTDAGRRRARQVYLGSSKS